MKQEPPELNELIGADVTPEERARLEDVDAQLRSVPSPPPEVPASVTHAVAAIRTVERRSTTRRRAFVGSLAAALAGLLFVVGLWIGQSEDFAARRTVSMEATTNAPAASGLIKLGSRDDETGNWRFRVEVSGLPSLPEGGYYVLWLAKNGEYAATCGTFNVGEGTTSVHMSASYRLADFDEWVVTAWLPDRDNAEAPWLLRAPTA